MGKLKLSVVLFLVMALSTAAFGQDLQGALEQLLEDNATSYMQPMVNSFGTAMNTGLVKKAKAETGLVPPFGLDLGLVIGVAQVPDEDLSYDFVIPDNALPLTISLPGGNSATVELPFSDIYEAPEAPTIAEDSDVTAEMTAKSGNDILSAIESQLSGNELTAFQLLPQSEKDALVNSIPSVPIPSGLGLSVGLAPMLNANVRIPFGIELSFRGLPMEVDLGDDIGTFTMYGGGLRKSLPVPIIDASVGGMYQVMNVGDIFTATNVNVHAEVGKSLGIPGFKISPYVGAGMDMTTVGLKYDYDPTPDAPDNGDEIPMDFEFEGDNGMRLTAGLSFQIPLIYIHAEVSQGTYQAASLSAGFIFK